MANKKRKYKRWVGIGYYDVDGLVRVARKHGMQCIHGFKYGMVFFATLALYGTPEQMRATESDWKKPHRRGLSPNEVRRRMPLGAFDCNLAIPRDEWAEKFIVQRQGETAP